MNKQQKNLFLALLVLLVVVLVVLAAVLLMRRPPEQQPPAGLPESTQGPATDGTADPLSQLSEDEIGRMAMEEEEQTDFTQLFTEDDTEEETGPVD